MWLNEGRIVEVSLGLHLPIMDCGSGKRDMAQAGGPDKAKLAQALEAAYEVVARKAKG